MTVVTGPGPTTDEWGPTDETLAAEIPDAEILELDVPEPERTPWGERRGEQWVGLATKWSRWWSEGVVRAGVATAKKVDVVIGTMPPYQVGPACRDARTRTWLSLGC